MICICAMGQVITGMSRRLQAAFCMSGNRGVIRVECAQKIFGTLWRVAVPQCPQFGDRPVMPIDAQIDQREAFMLHDEQMRTLHRPALAPPRRALPQARAAAVPPVAPSGRTGTRAAWRQARAHWPGCCRPRRRPERLPRSSPAGCAPRCRLRHFPLRPERRSAASAHAAWMRQAHPRSAAPSNPNAGGRCRVAQAADRCDAG
jgi:hypothetical protein